MVLPQEAGDLNRRAVSDTDPDNLGRRALQHAEAMKALILRDQHTIQFTGELPDYSVRRTSRLDLPDMEGVGEYVV